MTIIMTSTPPNAPELTDPQNDTIVPDTGENGAIAAAEPAEDTIARQQEQIDALIANTESLKSQIEKLIRGTSSNANEKPKNVNPQDTYPDTFTAEQLEQVNSDTYVYLSDLGAQFGKRDYKNINS